MHLKQDMRCEKQKEKRRHVHIHSNFDKHVQWLCSGVIVTVSPTRTRQVLLQHVTHTHTDWDKAMHFQRYRLRGPHTQTHTPHTHKKPAKLCTLLMLDWLGKTLRKVCRNSVALSGRLGNATPKRKALWTNTLLDRVKAPAQHQWNRACAKARSTSRRARAAVT